MPRTPFQAPERLEAQAAIPQAPLGFAGAESADSAPVEAAATAHVEKPQLAGGTWRRRLLLVLGAVVLFTLFVIALLPLPSIALANEPDQGTQTKEDAVTLAVTRFLREQTTPLGDSVEIHVRDGNARLGSCTAPAPFLPRPGVPQGRVTVGVRCDGERARYVQATVSASVRHLVAREALEPGEPVDTTTLDWQESDISRLPTGYLTSLAQAVGTVATRRVPSGTTLTDAMVRAPWLVKRGDTVVLTAVGAGFRVSRQVEALENGGMGSQIRLKTEDNRVLQGKVTGPDQLSVNF